MGLRFFFFRAAVAAHCVAKAFFGDAYAFCPKCGHAWERKAKAPKLCPKCKHRLKGAIPRP